MSQCEMCIVGFLLYSSSFTETVSAFTRGNKNRQYMERGIFDRQVVTDAPHLIKYKVM
jgi:hypothetical protein